MGEHKIYLYPKWLRIWHGINALSIILLIVTGISMQYSDVQYPFIRFDRAVSMHNFAGIVVSLSYLSFLVGNLISNNGIQYRLNFKGLLDRLVLQGKYYMFGYFRNEPKPFPITVERKFNPLQQVSYVAAMYVFVPCVVISGVALLYPEIIIDKFLSIGGIQLTAIFHAAMGFFVSLFLIIHLYVASVGKFPMKNYRSIINGYHED